MRRQFLSAVAAAALTGFAGFAFAGGQQIAAEVSPDGRSVLVRTYRCGEPSSLALGGSAEGVVAGQRRSIPLKIGAATAAGVFVVDRQWPSEGSWVLAFSVIGGASTSALVELAPGPGLRIVSQESSYQKPSARRIEAVLRASR